MPTNSEPVRPVSLRAEQQMRNWALEREVHDRLEQCRASVQPPAEVLPYVALSRQAGAGGSEVARRVGEKLGWQVVDKGLLDYIAQHSKLPKEMLGYLDETSASWLCEVVGKWIDSHFVTQAEFVRHLSRVLITAARLSSSVIVGRGAQFLLPRDKGVAIRLVAPLDHRVARVMQERQLTRDEAQRYIAALDTGRQGFAKRYFHHDLGDPCLFDLVINMGRLDYDGAVALIIMQCRHRGLV